MVDSIDDLIHSLANYEEGPDVHNQYRLSGPQQNLDLYLRELRSSRTITLGVGEAAGHRGCGITGIPFTSPAILASSTVPFFFANREALHGKGSTAETSSRAVWDLIGDAETLNVGLWNAFPFHPHPLGSPKANRRPRQAEIDAGKGFLQAVLEILKPAVIVAIGRVAQVAISSSFPEVRCLYVRHPAHGGLRAFEAGFRAVLASATEDSRLLPGSD